MRLVSHMCRKDESDQPTPEDIQNLLTKHRLSSAAAARMLRVSERTFRKWLQGKKPMPWAPWMLLQILVAEISPNEVPKSGADTGDTDRGTL